MSEFVTIIFFLIIAVLGIALYLLPTIIAVNRNHNNSIPIFIFNLLLGWSFLGWVLALVWSFTDNVHKETEERFIEEKSPERTNYPKTPPTKITQEPPSKSEPVFTPDPSPKIVSNSQPDNLPVVEVKSSPTETKKEQQNDLGEKVDKKSKKIIVTISKEERKKRDLEALKQLNK